MIDYSWDIFTGFYIINNVIYTEIEYIYTTNTFWYKMKLPNKKLSGPFHGRTKLEFDKAYNCSSLPVLTIGKGCTLIKHGTGLNTEYVII